METYVLSATLLKQNGIGSVNIMTDLRFIDAVSKEEATGKYVLEVSEEFPEHSIHIRPVCAPIVQQRLSDSQAKASSSKLTS
jgi:hypothetical protein